MLSQEIVISMLQRMADHSPSPFWENLDFYRAGTGCVMRFLSSADHAVSAGEISRHMKVSTARVAVLLRKMEERNLILRQRDEQDARRTLICLSPTGEALYHKLVQEFISWMGSVIEQVGVEKIEQFISISAEITQAMEQTAVSSAPDMFAAQ